MRTGLKPAHRRGRGFSLVELAVVIAIVAFLMGGLMYTLSAQTEQRSFEETRRRLELARELVLAFAITNGRLPCPARNIATSSPVTVPGDEVVTTATGCIGDAVTDYYGTIISAGPPLVTGGLLPARSIGFQQVDSAGFAVDAWGNRLRYVVANLTTPSATCPTPHFVNTVNLKQNGVGCQPNDLLICKSATGITGTTCGSAANQVMSTSLVVVIIYSTGKNGAGAAGGIDESANLNGDRIFVWHAPSPASAANGEFDDQLVWITHGELYGKLIAAGRLP
ncbi:MAG: prepilin-type N-terminal cleavage/methylation domain-containing protein [Burkholderiales bacterium]|nr:prepilin-type N-terminal cleavage/methylation domain-containing protein [Burkholderiales bacterium]